MRRSKRFAIMIVAVSHRQLASSAGPKIACRVACRVQCCVPWQVPSNCVGYVMGARRETLGKIEEVRARALRGERVVSARVCARESARASACVDAHLACGTQQPRALAHLACGTQQPRA